MTDPLPILIAGAAGRTGSAVVAAARQGPYAKRLALAGVLSRSRRGETIEGLPVFGSISDAPDARAVIDFTRPEATAHYAKECAEAGLAFVTGTTGLGDAEQAAVRDAATRIPVVQSGNMALGITMLLSLVEKAARALNGYDIEIVETHHRHKVDAPSGTALMLGEAAARGQDGALTERGRFTRHGQAGPRPDHEIGFAVVRGGGVPGDHTVHFLGEAETITLGHRALSRELFAEGALAAARWVVDRPTGLYTMRDVLGLD